MAGNRLLKLYFPAISVFQSYRFSSNSSFGKPENSFYNLHLSERPSVKIRSNLQQYSLIATISTQLKSLLLVDYVLPFQHHL